MVKRFCGSKRNSSYIGNSFLFWFVLFPFFLLVFFFKKKLICFSFQYKYLGFINCSIFWSKWIQRRDWRCTIVLQRWWTRTFQNICDWDSSSSSRHVDSSEFVVLFSIWFYFLQDCYYNILWSRFRIETFLLNIYNIQMFDATLSLLLNCVLLKVSKNLVISLLCFVFEMATKLRFRLTRLRLLFNSTQSNRALNFLPKNIALWFDCLRQLENCVAQQQTQQKNPIRLQGMFDFFSLSK